MKRQIKTLMAVVVLLACLPIISSTESELYADMNDTYIATVRFDDNVQITYALTYPSNDIWSGSADVPIGSMGNGAFDQIYCVDPFVPFHSRADDSYWDNSHKVTVDEKDGYTVAAPWIVSPALNQNYDAVRWIVLNGYRGSYYDRATDPESLASTAHLKALYLNNPSYPNITVIDETIALMATKLAIWKVLVGDSIVVIRTSLDNAQNPARRQSMDALVQALIDDSTADPQRTTSLQMTRFDLGLQLGGSGYTLLDTDNASYEIYGSLQVSASLTNTTSPLDLNRVYLTVSGPGAEDVQLMTYDGSSYQPLPFSATSTIYGTSTSAVYLTPSHFSANGSGLISSDIYLKMPYLRTPANSDQLVVRAYAMAENVVLTQGTPVTFVYGDNGIMNWDAVQAFIGAANDGMVIDMYDDAVINTGDTELGQLFLIKSIVNASPLDHSAQFTFQLLHSNSPSGPWTILPLSEAGTPGAHQVSGAISVNSSNPSSFVTGYHGAVQISGLAADTDDYYMLQETSIPTEYNPTPQYTIPLAANPVTVKTDGFATTGFQFNSNNQAIINFYNTRQAPKAHLYVGKAALVFSSDGSPPEQDITTVFDFQLQYSADNGITWAPQPLSSANFKSASGNLTDGPNGIFSLCSSDLAFIELDPNIYIYRVAEINLGPRYLAAYAAAIYVDDGLGGYNSQLWTSNDDLTWSENFTFVTSKINMSSGAYCYLLFDNFDIKLCDLEISKTVTDQTGTVALDDLYSFMVICRTDNLGIPVGIPLPLYDGVNSSGFIVEGINTDRLVNGSQNYTSVIQLKHGETATVVGLPAGTYSVVEVVPIDFTVRYSVNNGAQEQTLSGETRGIAILDETSLRFVNIKTVEPQKKTTDDGGDDGNGNGNGNTGRGRGTAATGDNAHGLLLISSMLAICGALNLFSSARRRVTKPS